jgi:hypothetical protein
MGLLWTVIGRALRTIPEYTQGSLGTYIHAPGGIRTRNPSKRTAADPRLRPRGHWDRHWFYNTTNEVAIPRSSLL